MGKKSMTAYVFTPGDDFISCISTSQDCATQSPKDGGHLVVLKVTKEAIWLDRLVIKMELTHIICCDSQSALHLTANRVMDIRLKHIIIKCHCLHILYISNMII